jgi:hypothetical protein
MLLCRSIQIWRFIIQVFSFQARNIQPLPFLFAGTAPIRHSLKRLVVQVHKIGCLTRGQGRLESRTNIDMYSKVEIFIHIVFGFQFAPAHVFDVAKLQFLNRFLWSSSSDSSRKAAFY